MATALVDLYGSAIDKFRPAHPGRDYRPSDAEDFMCDEQRAYFLRKLKDWKEVDRRRKPRDDGAAPGRLDARTRHRRPRVERDRLVDRASHPRPPAQADRQDRCRRSAAFTKANMAIAK